MSSRAWQSFARHDKNRQKTKLEGDTNIKMNSNYSVQQFDIWPFAPSVSGRCEQRLHLSSDISECEFHCKKRAKRFSRDELFSVRRKQIAETVPYRLIESLRVTRLGIHSREEKYAGNAFAVKLLRKLRWSDWLADNFELFTSGIGDAMQCWFNDVDCVSVCIVCSDADKCISSCRRKKVKRADYAVDLLIETGLLIVNVGNFLVMGNSWLVDRSVYGIRWGHPIWVAKNSSLI